MWKANPELQINIFDVQCAWKELSFLVENKLKFQKTVGRFSSKRITQTTHGELHVCFSIGSSKSQDLGARSSERDLVRSRPFFWHHATLLVELSRKIIEQFPRRLKACIEAKGGHFEHLL